ncbi:hypothetical protein FIBSPDRAFT_917439 [Athelia psychrophila]|uniref:MARVEL domain-containing protein n=1 Tax=Athelia psychrophila TaxID=1759441 RepID=A0A166SDW2_9AGAM|nr:hypothetical protein FIBSPDRAFT_917439 [Fibularhizoctonia sp. CBS 109695]
MGFDNHIRRGHPIVFGLLVFFSIVELAISAWLVTHFNKNHNNVSTTESNDARFLLFTSIWTTIFGLFYMGLFLHSASGSAATSILSHGIFLFFTWLFWTAGAAAITSELGGGLNCNHRGPYVYCGQLNALEGFAWVCWILTTFAIIVVAIRGFSAARRGDGLRGHLV